jgi:hypothetical protein
MGVVIATGATTDEAREKAKRAAAKVRVVEAAAGGTAKAAVVQR